MSEIEGRAELVIAGFWRRIGALLIDSVVLGVVGIIIGSLLYSSLARVGAPARLIGFTISLVYFGVLNSRLGHGQTLGKRWLGIRVVDGQGQLLSLGRSLVRYVVFGVPFFVNNVPLSATLTNSMVFDMALSLLVFGGGFAIVYLYIFNRRTRQSLHDLVVGSYVVSVAPQEGQAHFLPVWRVHVVVVALFALFCLGAPGFAKRLAQQEFFASLMPLYHTLQEQPHVMNAQVMRGWVAATGRPTTHYLSAQIRVDSPMTDDADYARSLAELMVKGDPHIAEEDGVRVGLAYGYDIGIASWWTRHVYSFKTSELQ
jgi:uncharacterized RDD family membrane protein YckC